MGSTSPWPTEQPPWRVHAPHLPQHEQHAVTERFALFGQLVEPQVAGLGEITTSVHANDRSDRSRRASVLALGSLGSLG